MAFYIQSICILIGITPPTVKWEAKDCGANPASGTGTTATFTASQASSSLNSSSVVFSTDSPGRCDKCGTLTPIIKPTTTNFTVVEVVISSTFGRMLCEGNFPLKASGTPPDIDKFTWSLTGSGAGTFKPESSTNGKTKFKPTKESASEDGTTIKVTYSVASDTADTTLTIPRHAKTNSSTGHLSSPMVDRNSSFSIFYSTFDYEMYDQFSVALVSSDRGGAIPTIRETGTPLGISNLRFGPPKIQKNYKACPNCVFTDEVGLNRL